MSANDKQVGGDHYSRKAIQHWDYVLANDIPYLEAQIIKYVGRWRDKNGIEDLKKAQHFLEKLIEHEEEMVDVERQETAHRTRSKPDEGSVAAGSVPPPGAKSGVQNGKDPREVRDDY